MLVDTPKTISSEAMGNAMQGKILGGGEQNKPIGVQELGIQGDEPIDVAGGLLEAVAFLMQKLIQLTEKLILTTSLHQEYSQRGAVRGLGAWASRQKPSYPWVPQIKWNDTSLYRGLRRATILSPSHPPTSPPCHSLVLKSPLQCLKCTMHVNSFLCFHILQGVVMNGGLGVTS